MRTRWSLAVVGMLGCTALGAAQYTSETAEWLFADPQEVVKTATRTERTVAESFTTVRVLSRREIELSGAQTIQELLERMVAEFEGQESSQHRFLSMRGAYSASEFNERMLFLLDGQPLNDPILGNFPAMSLSTHDVERVEVAFGPGSAMYGPNAFAGVVNIITQQSDTQRSSLWSGYTGRGGYNASLRWITPQGAPTRVSVQTSFWRDPGSDRIRNNDSTVRTVRLAFTQGTPERGQWRVNYLYSDLERGQVGMRYNTYATPQDRSHWRTHYFQVEYSREFGKFSQTSRLYGLVGDIVFHKVQSVPPFVPNAPLTRMAWQQSMLATETYYQWRLPTAQLLAGVDYRYMRASSGNHFGGSHTAHNLALYAQAEWQLGRWRPILGARFDAHSIYGNQFSPRVGFTYIAHERHRFRASLGYAFRAPSFTELYLRNYIVWWNFLGNPVPISVEGNPQLRPETTTTWEFGYRLLQPHWQLDVAFFSADLKHVVSVFPRDMNQPTRRWYQNLHQFRVWGYTADAVFKLSPCWTLQVGYMHVRHGVRVDYKPARHRAVFRLAYYKERGLSGQLVFNYPAVGQGFIDAYAWNTYLNLIYPQDDRSQWNLRIDNLFNVRTEMARGVPGGRRSLWFSYQRDW
ncbi:MAG: TonB-dependent receptor [Fimbriimonadales bacterium]|nr:TonB-dependent receptor [Fimbriimonadales bacterium]MDW8051276.1 TonB-dependent receptor [Armatimonadota bacterium]